MRSVEKCSLSTNDLWLEWALRMCNGNKHQLKLHAAPSGPRLLLYPRPRLPPQLCGSETNFYSISVVTFSTSVPLHQWCPIDGLTAKEVLQTEKQRYGKTRRRLTDKVCNQSGAAVKCAIKTKVCKIATEKS